jgi:transcription termination factor Rho
MPSVTRAPRQGRRYPAQQGRTEWILRKLLNPMEDVAATEFLIDRLKVTQTNDEFFESMKGKNK